MHQAARGHRADHADEAGTTGRAWFRPPFALEESDFIEKCTRCNACEQACTHEVIFPYSAKMGILLARTPAMDLVNKGCRLCSDWPCVQACPEEALGIPKVTDPLDHLRLARVSINENRCLSHLQQQDCRQCLESCPVVRAMDHKRGGPMINSANCVGCALCLEACIVEPKAIEIRAF